MANNDERFPTATFEEKLKMLSVMSDADRGRASEQVLWICKDYCRMCPTYQGTGETTLAFCTLGKSMVIKEQKGCLCYQCPMTKTMSLRWDSYCIRGKALDLSEAENR